MRELQVLRFGRTVHRLSEQLGNLPLPLARFSQISPRLLFLRREVIRAATVRERLNPYEPHRPRTVGARIARALWDLSPRSAGGMK